jgi:hypothetical protein
VYVLWLVLEEAHGLDVVSLVEGEAMVDPRRQHEQVASAHLNTNPLGILGVLNALAPLQKWSVRWCEGDGLGGWRSKAEEWGREGGQVAAAHANVKVALAVENVADLLVLVQVLTADINDVTSQLGRPASPSWRPTRSTAPEHVLGDSFGALRSPVTYVKKPLIFVS